MSAETFTEAEAMDLVRPVVAAAIHVRELEIASALNSALELAGNDSMRMKIAVEMIARTLIVSNQSKGEK